MFDVLQSGYYMPRADVVRRDYRVITPALKSLTFAGPAIAMECAHYDSYKLEKREPVPLIGNIINSFKSIVTFPSLIISVFPSAITTLFLQNTPVFKAYNYNFSRTLVVVFVIAE